MHSETGKTALSTQNAWTCATTSQSLEYKAANEEEQAKKENQIEVVLFS